MKVDPFQRDGASMPFLEVQRFLHGAHIRVPRVLDFNPDLGWILLEDLGDTTLLKKLEKEPQRESEFFLKALDGLQKLQALTLASLPFVIRKRAFDRKKFDEESRFTIHHFFEGFLGKTLPAREAKVLRQGFGNIHEILSKEPRWLTHRDFHSRNMMVLPGDELAFIDFQDARMGLFEYDVASLLRDSYYRLQPEVKERCLRQAWRMKRKLFKKLLSYDAFLRLFHLAGIQRNFKAIGSFASFYQLRGDVRYLKFVGHTFEEIRASLLLFPEYSSLYEVLYRYYYF
jgi:N-acetylmuramate 1-kinase